MSATTQPRYPQVTVSLKGIDGNAFFILGAVINAMRKASLTSGDIEEFKIEATPGDYAHLLQTCASYVNVE